MKAFIDIDGTLINSFERHHLLLQKIINDEKLNKKIDIKQYIEYKINGLNNYQYMTNYMGIEDKVAKEIQKKWIDEIENEEWIKYDSLYPDTIDFLEFLKEKKYEILFLTARKSEKNLIQELKRMGINKYADKIYVVNPSNAKENKKNIISINNINNHTIVVGDTETDFYAAKENMVKSYILNRGFRSKNYLDKIGVKENYDSLNQMKGIIK